MGPERLAAAPQHQISDRAAAKFLHATDHSRADTDPRAEPLVGIFEPRGRVHGVAVGGVVEQPPAAKIADQRRAGMDPKAGDAEFHVLRVPAFAEVLGPGIEILRAGHRA